MLPEKSDANDELFTEEEIKILDERRQKRLNGESTSHSWAELKAIITNKSKFNKSK